MDQVRKGDVIWTSPDDDPSAPAELKVVEEVFQSYGRVINIHVGGRVIRSTPNHPIFVRGKGWTSAIDLEPGDLLRSRNGRWMPVEEVIDNGEACELYNLRVADHHTYFVGSEEWGFSVWAHNNCRLDKNGRWHDAEGKFSSAPSQTGPLTVSPMRQMHIIYGGVPTPTGGGHSWRARVGAGVPGVTKTRFPKSISDAEIIQGAERIANDPSSYPTGVVPIGNSPKSKYTAVGYIRGVRTVVAVEPLGEGIITAHPKEL